MNPELSEVEIEKSILVKIQKRSDQVNYLSCSLDTKPRYMLYREPWINIKEHKNNLNNLFLDIAQNDFLYVEDYMKNKKSTNEFKQQFSNKLMIGN